MDPVASHLRMVNCDVGGRRLSYLRDDANSVLRASGPKSFEKGLVRNAPSHRVSIDFDDLPNILRHGDKAELLPLRNCRNTPMLGKSIRGRHARSLPLPEGRGLSLPEVGNVVLSR